MSRRLVVVQMRLLFVVVVPLALFSLCLCHMPRFYLGALVVCVVAFAVGCALVASSGGPLRRGAGVLVALAVVATTAATGQRIPAPAAFRASPAEVRASFADWHAAGDAGRRGRVVPFDVVQAQALGLYTPDSLATVKEWGFLPRQRHVMLLLAHGVIGHGEIAAP